MSDSLRYTKSKYINGELLKAKVELSDECGNGCQDFSVTGELWMKGMPTTDRNLICCGAMGDTIAKEMPELKQFCDLHLRDIHGAPMHAISNMHFHLRNRFESREDVETPEHKAAFCECYRITPEEFDALNKSQSEAHFALLFRGLPIAKRWQSEAESAIKELERLTNQTFENNSTRSNLIYPPEEEMQIEADRVASGYYSPEAIAVRKAEKEKARREAMISDAETKKQNFNQKFDRELVAYLALFDAGGDRAVSQSIYYDHAKTIKFNWFNSGNNLSQKEIDEIKSKAILPEGVKYES